MGAKETGVNMKMFKNIILLTLFFAVIIIPGCKKNTQRPELSIANISFRDVHGITKEEIEAIEALQKQYSQFSYGVIPSTEAFLNDNGKISGFSAMFSDWLSELFEIRFEPVYVTSPNAFEVIQRGEVDFTGDIRITEERREVYIATDPVALRSLKMIRIKGSEPIDQIAMTRLPRYAFVKDTASIDDVAAVTNPDSYETLLVSLFDTNYELLKNNELDAYIVLNIAESYYEEFDDIVVEDFFPLIFSPVSLLTGRPELAPIISVVQKVLDNGGFEYFNELYKKGYEEYRIHKFMLRLTSEEKEYLSKTSVVPFTSGYDFFPVGFYNKYEKKWEGSAFEILDEVGKLTGLTFEVVNANNSSMAETARTLYRGNAHLSPALIYSEDRKDMFLWSQHIYLSDKYALLSKREIPNISISEIPYAKIGLIEDMGYSEVFKNWFPQAENTVVFSTSDDAIQGLKRNEIDYLMATTDSLIVLNNYHELLGYKANYIFNTTLDLGFGFNRDQHILRSIFDKAFLLIDTDGIVSYWETMTYDHQSMILRAQRPWLIGAIVLSLIILSLVFILFVRSRSTGKQLEKLVKVRTGELEIRTSLLKTIFDSLPDIVFCKDLNFNYTQYNKVFMEFFGVDEKALIGKNASNGLCFPSNLAADIFNIDRMVYDNRQKLVLEEWIPSKSGEKRLFETIKAPLMQNGDVVGLISIARDVTERKAMEEDARAASRSKSAFLANMSHEIRTPLNVVLGLTDLVLEENNLSKNALEYLHKISSAGSTLLSIVNDILDFSKIESGKLTLVSAEYHICSLLNDVITLMSMRIEEKPVVFSLNICDKLPAKLLGDELRVKQILNNLLSNASKYTVEGTIQFNINTFFEEGNENDVWIEFSVSDTGIGIKQDDLDKLFNDYYQVESRAIRKVEGTGLGLSITKRLAEMMDGEVSAKSEYGKGSIFCARIRQGYTGSGTIDPAVVENLCKFRYTEEKLLVGKKLTRSDMSFAKVLVVDDMQTNLDVAAGLLGKYKMQVDCVLSGKEAIARIKSEKTVYNAIFMDHMMPEMDGIETADAIRNLNSEYAKKIPIIALTANAIHGTEDIFFAHGFQAFLSKPIDIMQLDVVIRKWITENKETL
jgi:PAS domain S-box-containing protein